MSQLADWIYDVANWGQHTPFLTSLSEIFRLDLLRGFWMIVLDHIPDDVVSWLTLHSYGFSGAAEFFNLQSA